MLQSALAVAHHSMYVPTCTTVRMWKGIPAVQALIGFTESEIDGKPVINIDLKYFNGKPVIEEIKRVSRPGLRNYQGKDDLPENRAGLGIVILTTNKGLMTEKQARAAGIGGEVLCTVF